MLVKKQKSSMKKKKIRISRYAILHGNRQAAEEFPKLNESCV